MKKDRNKNGSGKKSGKGLKIAGAVLIVFIPVQLFVMGWFGGLGPFKGMKDVRMGKHPGNAPEYDFDKISALENSPLAGKQVCILGSSVVYGSASGENAVGEYLSARLGFDLTKEAVSGTTLVDIGEKSYISRLKNRIDPNTDFDLFICQLSTNDATGKRPLGKISDNTSLEEFDTSTVTGALEYIICYAQQTWGCPVVFFTGSRYDSIAYEAMVERLTELKDKYDICVLDLWHSDTFNALPEEQRKIYMVDNIHPSKAGYRDWWGPELEKQLLAYLNREEEK